MIKRKGGYCGNGVGRREFMRNKTIFKNANRREGSKPDTIAKHTKEKVMREIPDFLKKPPTFVRKSQLVSDVIYVNIGKPSP